MPQSPSRPSAARPMRGAVVVVVLTLLLGIQPVNTDLYLPALPTLQHSLGASVGAAQLTLSMLTIAFGPSQLLCGPLADRFGRRPVLLVGLALYTAAALGGAAAPSIDALVAWRALQGVRMAAAVTCGRSVVRDLYEPAQGARVMSRALTGLGFIAVASPLIGGFLVEAFAWPVALLALAVFGAVALPVVALRLKDTVPAKNLNAIRPSAVAANWAGVAAVWAIALPQYLYAIGHGIHQPCSQAGAIGPFPEKAGTAASLSGFVMTLTALLAGLGLGGTLDATVHPMTLGVGAFSVLVAIVAWALVQRHGEPAGASRLLAEVRLA